MSWWSIANFYRYIERNAYTLGVKLKIAFCDELDSFSSFPRLVIRGCRNFLPGCKQCDLQRLPSFSSFDFDGCEEVESFFEGGMHLPYRLALIILKSCFISFLYKYIDEDEWTEDDGRV